MNELREKLGILIKQANEIVTLLGIMIFAVPISAVIAFVLATLVFKHRDWIHHFFHRALGGNRVVARQ